MGRGGFGIPNGGGGLGCPGSSWRAVGSTGPPSADVGGPKGSEKLRVGFGDWIRVILRAGGLGLYCAAGLAWNREKMS